ncbi:hypothetical protein D3C83_154540 [compost metagenome]
MSSYTSMYVRFGRLAPMTVSPKKTGWSPAFRKIAISPLSNIPIFFLEAFSL